MIYNVSILIMNNLKNEKFQLAAAYEISKRWLVNIVLLLLEVKIKLFYLNVVLILAAVHSFPLTANFKP